ncbi:MAG: pilin [Patescibacteria group bacterium]|nr:pilin [Patescibacteria group bacterium]
MNKKITAVLFLLIFVFMPSTVLAVDCDHCWCLGSNNVCEHHTEEDETTGEDVETKTQCDIYCASRTTSSVSWKAVHCDDGYIDWNEKPGDECYGVTGTSGAFGTGGSITQGVPFSAIEPSLQIPDFNIQFSKLMVSDVGGQKFVSVPWLAEYIAAVYRYMVGVATILAITMIMYGGFRWVTAAGDSGKISEAKKSIIGAAMGLVLALGSYTLLNLINPDLVSFNSLRLAIIGREEITFDEGYFGGADDSSSYDATIAAIPAAGGFVSYADMMKACPEDKSYPANYAANLKKVIDAWSSALPKKVVYVGGGTMKSGACTAPAADNYYNKKLAKNGFEEWNGDIDAYRSWAQSLGSIYCGDCLTFTRTLYKCIADINPLPDKTNQSKAKYYYSRAEDMANDLENKKISLSAGTFIWLDGNCGHAINYTGISGKEIIEMGGGPPAITVNNHTARSVRVKSSLIGYLKSGWVKNCPVYAHEILANPDLYR